MFVQIQIPNCLYLRISYMLLRLDIEFDITSLKTCWIFCEDYFIVEKCFSIDLRNILPMVVLMFLLYCRSKQIKFLFLFVQWKWKFSLLEIENSLFFRAFIFLWIDKNGLLKEISNNQSLMGFVICLTIRWLVRRGELTEQFIIFFHQVPLHRIDICSNLVVMSIVNPICFRIHTFS